MTDNQKKNLKIIILISIVYFVIFIFPNSVGSSNSNMVLIFEPDEAVQLTPTLNMIRPRDSLYESAKRFFAYRHYFYGFPFFASSAMFLLPFRLTDNFESTQSIMLVLRQLISVAPMLLTIILWVYLQTKFKSRAHTILLFLFLLTIPAVTRNSFWWHPESLVLLFITGTFYFLEKDQFKFKKYFFWAAISCGFAIGTKLLGLFFFLTIPTYLVVGIFQKRISPREVIVLGSKFFGVMILSIIISNPLIIVPRVFQQYLQTQAFQANKMSFGWEVAYSSEPSSWFGLINNYYAPWHIIILSFIGIIYGIYKNKNRFLNINILTWVLPFTIYFLYFIVVKPTHYLLPIAIPLFSSILNFWPDKNYKENTRDNLMRKIMIYVIFLSVIFQIILNFQSGIITYSDKLTREESSDSIQFFQYVNENYLGKSVV